MIQYERFGLDIIRLERTGLVRTGLESFVLFSKDWIKNDQS